MSSLDQKAVAWTTLRKTLWTGRRELVSKKRKMLDRTATNLGHADRRGYLEATQLGCTATMASHVQGVQVCLLRHEQGTTPTMWI